MAYARNKDDFVNEVLGVRDKTEAPLVGAPRDRDGLRHPTDKADMIGLAGVEFVLGSGGVHRTDSNRAKPIGSS